MEETRVGYAAVSVLRDVPKETILTYTRNGCYEGNVNYLRLYEEYTAFLTDAEKK